MQLKKPAMPRGFEFKYGKCETRFFRSGLSEKKPFAEKAAVVSSNGRLV